MSAQRRPRPARWRQWVASVPVLLALLFATTTITAHPATAGAGVPAPLASQLLATTVPQGMAPRPELPVFIRHGGSWTVAPDVGVAAWAAAQACTVPAGWLTDRQAVGGWRTDARRETYQGRGPPTAA